MSSKIRVLVISVDVGNLSDEQIDNLQLAMEAQVEVDYTEDEAYILSSDVRFINENGDVIEDSGVDESDSNLH